MLSTDPSHRPRLETAVGSCRSISSSLGVRRGSDLAVWRAGDTPPARTERATKSVSSRAHSRRVCSCAYAMTSDCRHRIRRRGVSPIGSEDFRYLFSDLHGPRAAATPVLLYTPPLEKCRRSSEIISPVGLTFIQNPLGSMQVGASGCYGDAAVEHP